jgi:hypothetical protein
MFLSLMHVKCLCQGQGQLFNVWILNVCLESQGKENASV